MHLEEEPNEVKPVDGLVYNNNANAVVKEERSFFAKDFSQYHWSGRLESSLGLPFQMSEQCEARWRMIEADSDGRDHARIPDLGSNSGWP